MHCRIRVHFFLAILEVLSLVNFLALGIYINNLCFNWPTFDPSNFIFEGYIALAFTMVGIVLLIYALIKTWKGDNLKSGIANLAAGALLGFFIYYFTLIIQPSFLGWLGILAFFLISPSILSGILGITLRETTKPPKEFDVV